MQIDWFFQAFGYEAHIYRDKKLARYFDVWREDDDWLFNLEKFRGTVSPVRPQISDLDHLDRILARLENGQLEANK